MSMVTERKVMALETRVAALETELAALRAALELSSEVEPRRKPGRPRKDEVSARA